MIRPEAMRHLQVHCCRIPTIVMPERQMVGELTPYPALVRPMFSHFPLTLAKHFEAGGIDDQVSDVPLGKGAVCHLHRAGPLAHAAIVRGAQWRIHQRKQRVEQALGRSQRKTENPFEHEKGADGLVGVELTASPATMVILMEPVVHGLGIHPEGQRPSMDQGFVVARPVGERVK